jgi:hypothetical protein
MDFASFILAHDADDLGALALSRSRFAASVSDFDLALTTLEVRRKLRLKVPQWYAVPALQFPLRLSGEQCSSAETARYKASLVHGRVADLTGGLGVDSWAFAQVATEVLYNEMRPALAAAASANFSALGLTNIRVSNCELMASSARPSAPSCPAPTQSSCPAPTGHLLNEVLDGFEPDFIFLDPARRASDGRKVFRLEDCQPDVLQLLPDLFAAAPHVLLKLSPMADISLVCKQLGSVRSVHVVAADGECKELLLLLERGYIGPYSLFVYENGSVLEIPGQAGNDVVIALNGVMADLNGVMADFDRPSFLFEPGKGLLKAGAFDLPCRYGLEKLDRHTHLYIGPAPVEALTPFGKWFRILEVLPLDKRGIKDIGRRYPKASVTARNIPLTSDALRKKLGVSDGGTVHIFGVRTSSGNTLLVCE